MLFFRGTSQCFAFKFQWTRQIIRLNSTNDINPGHQTFVIPNRIKRNSTDILNALASTVGNDPTAAHYKYHDDPYLIPLSNVGKRTFALAQESGRKAAKWVQGQHGALFQHSVAQPPIKAFAPKMIFNDESEVDNECLQTLIKNSEIQDAVFVYNLMKTKNLPITDNIKEELLQMLCYYNNDEPLSEEFIEERWLKQSTVGKESQRKTWKDGDLAEQIFQEIEPKNGKCYSAIISGMCKYYQAERGYSLYQEAIDKGMNIDRKCYNSILGIVSFLKESGESRWELCNEILNQMNQNLVKPDVGTLNSILSTISSINNFRLSRKLTLKSLSEFKRLQIEPSLATWYYVLIIFCRDRGPVSHVIVDILNEIEHKEFQILDLKDTYFFVTAMDICRNHLYDKILAKRVNQLLHVGNNYDLIGDSYKESIYYRHYFGLLCQSESLDDFMKIYDLLVPNIYIPEPGIMEEILKAIDSNGALELVPKIWSDIIIFEHTNRESILNRILKIMCENKLNADIPAYDGLATKFGNIGLDIYNKINEQSEQRIQKLSFTGQMLGEILTVVSRADNWEKAQIIFNKLDKCQHQIPGTPKLEALEAFVQTCINNKSPSNAILCLEYCVENGLDSNSLVKLICEGFTLDVNNLNKIKNLVGEKAIEILN